MAGNKKAIKRESKKKQRMQSKVRSRKWLGTKTWNTEDTQGRTQTSDTKRKNNRPGEQMREAGLMWGQKQTNWPREKVRRGLKYTREGQLMRDGYKAIKNTNRKWKVKNYMRKSIKYNIIMVLFESPLVVNAVISHACFFWWDDLQYKHKMQTKPNQTLQGVQHMDTSLNVHLTLRCR